MREGDLLTASETVERYKDLSLVENAFRSLKTVDLKVRPIHHHEAARVRYHIFLCMLAYYVEWHMRSVKCNGPSYGGKAERNSVLVGRIILVRKDERL